MKAAADRESSEERSEGKSVILDVGGDRFVASRKSLERFPSTRYHHLMHLRSKKIFKNLESFTLINERV